MRFNSILASIIILSFSVLQNLHAQNNNATLDQSISQSRSSKIQERANRRLVKPNTHIVTLSLLNSRHPIILIEPSFSLPQMNSTPINLDRGNLVNGWNVGYQYNLPQNFFAEGDFSWTWHGTTLKPNRYGIKEGGIISIYNNSFITYSLNIGGGYRFVGKNNLRFFDVHAGFVLGMTDNKVNTGGGYGLSAAYLDYNDNAGMTTLGFNYRISSRTYYGFYLGISKDIRITENLHLRGRYQYQFGKSSSITEHTIFYSLPTLGLTEVVRAEMTAKAQIFSIGLSWYFDKNN